MTSEPDLKSIRRLVKIGGGYGIILPIDFVELHNLEAGDKLLVSIVVLKDKLENEENIKK